MSTGPGPQAAFIQGTMEQDATQSTILYLLQEASKLASPAHNGLLDSNPPPTWPNKMSRQDPFVVKMEAKDPLSFHVSNCYSQHSLSHMLPYNQANNCTEDSHNNKVTASVQPSPQCNSPWKVLSLINLQCERLLHHRDVEEPDSGSVSCTAKLSHSTGNSSTSATGVPDQGCGGDSVSPECTSLISEREGNPACISPTEDVIGELRGDCSEGSSGFPVQCRVKDSKVGSIVQPQTPEKIDTVRRELVDKNTTAYSQPAHRDNVEVKLSVITGLEWNEESKEDCFSTEQATLNATSSEKALSQTRVSAASDNTIGQLNQQLSVALYPSLSTKEYLIQKPALTLDLNSNLALTVGSLSYTQLPPQSSLPPSSQSLLLLFSSEEGSHILIEQDDKITASKPQCRPLPIEAKSPQVPQLKSPSYRGETNPPPSSTSKPERRQVPTEGCAPPFPQQCSSKSSWTTKTPRKQPHPSRSADIQDPDFQGVTFRMDTELDDSREQCRLLITSKYSKELYKSVRKPRARSRSSQSSLKTSSSDEESDPTTSISKSKVCASCGTKKTPMWRDAEDGTPLCNACGIRYKKYRVRCVNCWHIPRKEGNSNSCCLKCGNFVRLTSAQRKHTA